jgi:hypothetical protein
MCKLPSTGPALRALPLASGAGRGPCRSAVAGAVLWRGKYNVCPTNVKRGKFN